MFKSYHDKITIGLLFLIAFFIPFFKPVIPWLIGLLLFNWVLEGKFKAKFQLIKNDTHRRNILLFSVLYLVYLLGMVYTSNIDVGLFKLEVKLSLLIFPLLFATFPYYLINQNRRIWLLLTFVSGAIIAALTGLIIACFRFLENGDPQVFYYSELSAFMHAGYFAMFLDFALVILLYFIIHFKQYFQKRWILFALTIASVFVFIIVILLSMKIGVLGLYIVVFFSASHAIVITRNIKVGSLMIAFMLVLSILSVNLFPNFMNRIQVTVDVMENQEAVTNETEESTGERLLIWKYSVDIIRENLLFGVGTGDASDRMIEEYESNNLTVAVEKRLNAHNQFLQTFITLGFIGFSVLVLSLMLPLSFSYKKDRFIYGFFLILTILNMLVESTLETQAGVVFYAFFNCMLLFVLRSTEEPKIAS